MKVDPVLDYADLDDPEGLWDKLNIKPAKRDHKNFSVNLCDRRCGEEYNLRVIARDPDEALDLAEKKLLKSKAKGKDKLTLEVVREHFSATEIREIPDENDNHGGSLAVCAS